MINRGKISVIRRWLRKINEMISSKKPLIPKLIAALLLANLASFQCIAEVYKWVDENGKIHFSDKPFDEKSKAVKMKRQPTPEEIQQAKQRAARVIQHQRKVSEITSEEAQQEQQARMKREKKSAILNKECKMAQTEIIQLGRGYRSYTVNDKGEKYFLSDQEKNDMIAKMKELVKQHCPKED